MWELIEYLKKEGSVVKNAPVAFLACLIIGFSVGQYLRSEQIADRDGKISLRDDQIAALQKQLGAALSGAEKGQTDKSEVPSIKPEFLPKPKNAPDYNTDTDTDTDIVETSIEGGLSAKQIASLELTLKANPSSVVIRRAKNTPKVFADQIQGVFNASGWKMEVRESKETSDRFVVKTTNRESSLVLEQAFEGARISYSSYDDDQSTGSMAFYLDAPK